MTENSKQRPPNRCVYKYNHEIPRNRWVPVSESLPTIGCDVVVWLRCGEMDFQRCYNNGRWQSTWADGWNPGQRYEITHWMLVTPPEGIAR